MGSKQLFANNAKGRLNAGITDVATTLALQAGQGALFPNPGTGQHFIATLIKSATGAIEVIKVTARSGDTFSTVARAQEGTSSIAFDANDKVELRPTKGTLEGFTQKPAVETVAANETLDAADINTRKIVTASATLTLPATTVFDIGDGVDVKSLTTGNVQIAPDGTDTIDGLNANFRVPSYTECRIEKIASGQWALVRRPEVSVGEVKWWPVNSATPPQGYLFSDNVAENRTTYAALFAVYGTTHGAGDGSTTFGKADMRGRVPIGRDDMGGAAAGRITNSGTHNCGIDGTTIGASGGDQRTQQHTHIQDPHAHGYTRTDPLNSGGGGALANNNVAANTDQTTATNQNYGSGNSQNVQPGLIGNWIVKT